jgi:hypothetical protein
LGVGGAQSGAEDQFPMWTGFEDGDRKSLKYWGMAYRRPVIEILRRNRFEIFEVDLGQ